MLLVVCVHAPYRRHPLVIVRFHAAVVARRAAGGLPMPVKHAPRKRTDERRPRLRTSDRLRVPKNEREVARHALRLELPARLDSLPRGRELDEDPAARHARTGVGPDDAARSLDRRCGVEGQPGVHLSRNVSIHQLRDFSAEDYGEALRREFHGEILVAVAAPLARLRHARIDGLGYHGGVGGVAVKRGLRNEQRIRSGVRNQTRRRVFGHGREGPAVYGEGGDGGKLFQLGRVAGGRAHRGGGARGSSAVRKEAGYSWKHHK
mmetsp:Transcript_3122/g.6442  ORF Transcript_3122/g.6442 Transcript_3122/m.6442 type:complete len:263 (+) Transcript_3122:440-1228(+)